MFLLCRIVGRPKEFIGVTTMSGDKAQVSVQNQRAYVDGFQRYFLNGREIVDPTIGIINSGVVADVTATLSDDRSRCKMALEVTISKLLRIEEMQVEIADSTLTVELPQTVNSTQQVEFDQPLDSSCLLVSSPKARWLVMSFVSLTE